MAYWYIAGAIAAISLVSFSGAFLLSIAQERLRNILFILVSLATGALLGNAIIHLLPEAFHEGEGIPEIPLVILAGMLVFFVLEKFLRWHHAHTLDAHECEHCEPAQHVHPEPIGPLILIADTVHNVLDGAIIAATFLVSPPLGIAATVAIILHEIPQEIGDFGLLLHAGYSRGKALLFNFFSALSAGAGAILVICAQSFSDMLMPYIIAFAAGNFLYIAASDLLPELHKTTNTKKTIIQICFLLLGIGLMYALTFFVTDPHDEISPLESYPAVAVLEGY